MCFETHPLIAYSCCSSSFKKIALYFSIVGINHGLLIYSSMGGHLGYFQFLAGMKTVAVDVLAGVFWMT